MTHFKAQTRSGKLVSLTAPRADEVRFNDVAFQLARLMRFNGAAGDYSVAQHCVEGADEIMRHLGAPQIARAFLLHDAHEYILGDMTLPVQRELTRRMSNFAKIWNDCKFQMDRCIHRAAGAEFPHFEATQKIIAEADQRMLATELRDLVINPPVIAAAPYNFILQPRHADEISAAWLERLVRWAPEDWSLDAPVKMQR